MGHVMDSNSSTSDCVNWTINIPVPRCPRCGQTLPNCPDCGQPIPAPSAPWYPAPWPGYPQPYIGDPPYWYYQTWCGTTGRNLVEC